MTSLRVPAFWAWTSATPIPSAITVATASVRILAADLHSSREQRSIRLKHTINTDSHTVPDGCARSAAEIGVVVGPAGNALECEPPRGTGSAQPGDRTVELVIAAGQAGLNHAMNLVANRDRCLALSSRQVRKHEVTDLTVARSGCPARDRDPSF